MDISDDSSIISGISNISRISRTNSTALKLDSTCNNSEWRSMCRDFNKSLTIDQKTDSKKLEFSKINKALASYDDSTCDYAILKLIQECLEDIISSEYTTIDTKVLNKLRDFITIHKVKKYCHLPNSSKHSKDELTLLGIIDLPGHEFSYQEQSAIKSALETKMRERIREFITIYENSIGSSKELLKTNESMLRSHFQQKGDIEGLHWKDKIDEICFEYYHDLCNCLKEIKHFKTLGYKVNEKNANNAENLLLQAEITETKAHITKLTCTIRMYKETPITVEAFKILNYNLDSKISSISEEIDGKTELLKAYNALSSTEYDEILRKYSEICLVIQKKKNLLEKL